MCFKNDFVNYVRSGHSLLSIKTHEKERAEKDIVEAMLKEEYEVFTWSIAAGWRKPNGEEACESSPDPQITIQEAVIGDKFKEKSIFLLRDFGPYVQKECYNDFDIVISWLNEVKQKLSSSQKVIVFLGPEFPVPISLRHDITEIEYVLPDLESIERAVRFSCSDVETADGKKLKLSEDNLPNVVNACKGMTQSQIIDRVTLALRKTHGKLDNEAIKILLHEKAGVIRSSGILTYAEPEAGGLDMVGGLNLLKDHVQLDLPCFSDEAQKFGIRYPKGVLLVGIPGCGKTLISIAIASAFGYPLIKMDVGDLFSKWVGESESNMSEAIRILESVAPCVLQLDEIEKGFGGSGESDGGSSQRVFGKFLKWLNDRTAPVYVIATANNIAMLPPEFSRKGRFDEIFGIDLPTQDERREIFKIHITKRGRKVEDFDIKTLAKAAEHYTGADIEATVEMGLKIAFHAKSELTQAYILEAIKSVKPLAETDADRIEKIREWCKTRAKPASDQSEIAKKTDSTRKVTISGSKT
jgi:ATP-dependent 26S proteasome regulatory subunit